VHDQKHERPHDKEGLERQFDIEKWQFDRAFEQEVTVRHRAGGDRKIKESEQIADPEAGAYGRSIDDGIAQRPQILCLGSERCRLRFLRRQVATSSGQHAAPSLARFAAFHPGPTGAQGQPFSSTSLQDLGQLSQISMVIRLPWFSGLIYHIAHSARHKLSAHKPHFGKRIKSFAKYSPRV
jgi:hypothetical protein